MIAYYLPFLSNTVGPGIAEGDENCKKFMEKTMPDAFQKVSRLLFRHGLGIYFTIFQTDIFI
jgi:hypothetical protein